MLRKGIGTERTQEAIINNQGIIYEVPKNQ